MRPLSAPGWGRTLLAAALLLACYGMASLVLDPNGYLGTDTGAKVATLEMMDRRGSARPDLGYWAEDLDPDGSLHPVHDARPVGDAWVHVTTLPMLELARPLYAVGGYRLALLLPMGGAVGAAFAARSLARRLGSTDDGWTAFWVTGLGSPVAVYALDLWEHSVGLACMLGAVALLLDVADGRILPAAPAAGFLFGAAAALRTEALVYTAVGVAGVCLVLLMRARSLVRALAALAAVVVGFAVPWLANAVLESSVGGLSRTERATGRTSAIGRSGLGERVEVGLQTLLGFNAGTVAQSVLLGAAVVVVIIAALRADRRGDHRFAFVCVAAAALAFLVASLNGLGFIPGLFLALPLALAGLLHASRPGRARMAVVIAVIALPLVYLSQPLSGAAPQWGGRYTLTSGAILAVVGLVGLRARFPTAGRGLIVLSVLATVLGVAWLGVRSHGAADFFDEVVTQSEPVLVVRQAFLIREAGPRLVDQRWLSTQDEESFTEAVELVRALGEERFSVLEWDGEAPPPEALPPDVAEVERIALEFIDVPVGLVSYEFVP